MIFKTHHLKVLTILKRIEAQIFYDKICGNAQSTSHFHARTLKNLQMFYPILNKLHTDGYTTRMEVIHNNSDSISINITVELFKHH